MYIDAAGRGSGGVNMKYLKMVFIGLIFLSPSILSAGEISQIKGYKGAKWGMSPGQVKTALNLKGVREKSFERYTFKEIPFEKSDYIGFDFGGPLILGCWFYHGKLYHVKVPFYESDQKTTDVRMALGKKYGEPSIIGLKDINGECDIKGEPKTYTECAVWNTGDSRVTLWGGLTGMSNGYAQKIDYENLTLSQKAKDAEELKKKKDGEEYKREKAKELNEQL